MTFIETQFPVSKLSKESFKERKAAASQTLTGLGKWWGRKPLILCRAVIIGSLMPNSGDYKKDNEIFLKILTMCNDGLKLRKNKAVSLKRIESIPDITRITKYLDNGSLKKDLTRQERAELQNLAFEYMSYDEKLTYCQRPEEIDVQSWDEINSHLATTATNICELVEQLGERMYGHKPIVGDVFCGGGSIPFEAARIGCDSYASDLNPIAAFLTHSALNASENIEAEQRSIYENVCKQMQVLGFESNEFNEVAEYFLYCVEITCPYTKINVPVSPSWVISKQDKVCVVLVYNKANNNYDFNIIKGATDEQMAIAESGTYKKGRVSHTMSSSDFPFTLVRGDGKGIDDGNLLRKWEISDIYPRNTDIIRERLYAIRWRKPDGTSEFRVPTPFDLKQEVAVLNYVSSNFESWQARGFIPGGTIESGAKTNEMIRGRGWSYWHQLFNPRQLLVLSLISQEVETLGVLSGIGFKGIFGNRNCKLVVWADAPQSSGQVFSNQAYNTLFNHATRGCTMLSSLICTKLPKVQGNGQVVIQDARKTEKTCDIWITDPPYADAVNYDELSEFFIAVYGKQLQKFFPEWRISSNRNTAVKGKGAAFKESMMQIYKQLALKMPDNGMQIVMFTHQDAAVWSDLATILWAAGLQVTAAWCIQTETASGGLKKGNYVQGTVILVLRKKTCHEKVFLDEITHELDLEVRNQIDLMHKIDSKEDPNFSDVDFQLAAFAAALKILTKYNYHDFNPELEISKELKKNECSKFTPLIQRAIKTAFDYLLPDNMERDVWRELNSEERFYIKALELQGIGSFKDGAASETARNAGVGEYKKFFSSLSANDVKLKTPSQIKNISDTFNKSVLGALLKGIATYRVEEDVIKAVYEMRDIRELTVIKDLLVKLLRYLIQINEKYVLDGWNKNDLEILCNYIQSNSLE